MTKFNDTLDNTLGITDIVEKQLEVVSPKPKPVVKTNNNELENDYKYQRENFYQLVERGQDAVQGILDLARESEHPRAFEVAGNLIKQVADTVDKLQDLQGKLKSLKDVPNKTNTNIKQALFVGSSKELHTLLKNKNKDVQSDEDKSFKGKTITPTETDISDKWFRLYK